jgi:hypothetical protein
MKLDHAASKIRSRHYREIKTGDQCQLATVGAVRSKSVAKHQDDP